MVSVVLPITTPQEIAALAKGEIGIEALASSRSRNASSWP